MFQHQDVWFPDGETHMTDWMTKNGELVDGKGTYQIKKFREAMKWCKQFRGAVDCGAHVGLWARLIANKFLHVDAFEPVESFRKCFVKNVEDPSSYSLWPCALGATTGTVSMVIDRSDTGGSHVCMGSDVELKCLDDCQFVFELDFIKIDCEGYEHHVIEGGRETILRNKPCIIVEQKPHIMAKNYGTEGTPAVDILKGMGAKVRTVLSGDYILSWD